MKLEVDNKIEFVTDKEALDKRLENLTLNYGVNQIYSLNNLPKKGSIKEYVNQPIILMTKLKSGECKLTPIVFTEIEDIEDNKYRVKYLLCSETDDNYYTIVTDNIGVGTDEKDPTIEYRLWPRSYELKMEEIIFFYRTQLGLSWKENKALDEKDLYKFMFSEDEKELQDLVETRNVGLLINLNRKFPEYIYVRISGIAYNSKDSSLLLMIGSEKIKLYNFKLGTVNKFSQVGFKLDAVFDQFINYDFSDYNIDCKLIEL